MTQTHTNQKKSLGLRLVIYHITKFKHKLDSLVTYLLEDRELIDIEHTKCMQLLIQYYNVTINGIIQTWRLLQSFVQGKIMTCVNVQNFPPKWDQTAVPKMSTNFPEFIHHNSTFYQC